MSTLTIDVVTDATAAAADLDSVASAARGAGDAVATAGGQVQTAGSDFDALGDGADNVASKSSQAAGAMGDLAGGLSAVGATGAATALEATAIATQVAAGAGDILNLVASTTVGKFVLQTATMVASKAAMVASAIATGTMTAAQTALNVVMAANPIVLVVIAIAALAAGLIYAYKHSETFRNIVDGAMSRARQVIDDVSAAVQRVLGWFADLPGNAREAWEAVRKAVDDKIQAAIDRVQELVDGIGPAVSGVVGTVAGYFTSMFAPIQTAIDFVQDLIDKIKSMPSVDVNPFNRSILPGGGGIPGGKDQGPLPGDVPAYPNVTIPITVNGALDKDGTARTILELLQRYGGRSLAFDGPL